jgi:hypothetical protein
MVCVSRYFVLISTALAILLPERSYWKVRKAAQLINFCADVLTPGDVASVKPSGFQGIKKPRLSRCQ